MHAAPDKEIIAWHDTQSEQMANRQRHYLLAASGVGFIAMLAIGLWLHDVNSYLASAVFLAIGACFARPNNQRATTVTLTRGELRIGHRRYHMAELVGFWLREERGFLTIIVERKQALLPLTLTYRNTDAEEARDYFLEALPELEPQDETLNDRINGWLKL